MPTPRRRSWANCGFPRGADRHSNMPNMTAVASGSAGSQRQVCMPKWFKALGSVFTNDLASSQAFLRPLAGTVGDTSRTGFAPWDHARQLITALEQPHTLAIKMRNPFYSPCHNDFSSRSLGFGWRLQAGHPRNRSTLSEP